MNAKRIVVPVLCAAVIFSLSTGLSSAAQKNKEQVFIPKEVKADIQEDLASRQGRQDIPVSIFQTLYLPARENFHAVFFMKIKNSDLGFAPAAAAPTEATTVQGGPQDIITQEVPAELRAEFNVFLQFNRLDKNGVPEVFREAYVPTTLQVPAAGYEAEKEEVYSVGYPLPFGDYVIAVALTSLDLQKVGIAYHEISIPDPTQFSKTLDTTPIFFAKKIDEMPEVEPRIVFHKDFFTYAILKIVPNLDRVFSAGENLDIFFFIFGAQPNSAQQYEIEIDFEVKKGEEMQIQFSPQTYTTPMISQPLPMKQTVKIKKGEEERIEQRDLPAGNYSLVITLLDKVSQNTVVKTVDFEVK
ncbi:MAG: hypothetical protein WBC70_11325 [Candidatus Aminicenantales bacterium]